MLKTVNKSMGDNTTKVSFEDLFNSFKQIFKSNNSEIRTSSQNKLDLKKWTPLIPFPLRFFFFFFFVLSIEMDTVPYSCLFLT